MVGSATVTAVPSMNVRLEPRLVAARTHGPASRVHRDLAALDRITPSSQGCWIMPTITALLSAILTGG
jgi:hypothetical protein